MKILLVHDFYQQFGGEDASVLAEKELLEGHGETLTLFTRYNTDINDYSAWNKLTFPIHVIHSPRTIGEINTIVREFRPDTAYIHNVFPLISPSVYTALTSHGVPSVQVIHDFRFLCPNGWFYTQGHICERCKHGNYLNALRYRCFRNSYFLSALYGASIFASRYKGLLENMTAFICPTEFSKDKLLEVGVAEDRIFIKPHFIDASRVEPRPGQGDYVLYLGRLSGEKGLWTLIRAFEQLPELKLKIAGTGPIESALKLYVKEKGLKNVEFLGFRQGQEKWKVLSDSLFIVVPSEWYETFCIVVLEGYAAGKPVIGSDLGGLPYVIENGKSGLLFEPGCVEGLLEMIIHLVNHCGERERMGRYGRKLVETHYGPARNYAMLMNILSQVGRRA
jgi:glycosyltransferase involved in cell wall biosynthesis